MLAARELTITLGSRPEYWTWFSVPESRFSEIAYLNAVLWLEIKVVINACMLSPRTNHAAYLVFILKTNSFGFEDAVVKSSIKIGDETTERRWMTNQGVLHSAQDPTTIRKDRWLEIELGEFFTEGREDIRIKIKQLDLHWKKGLMVEGIEIRPKDNL